MLNYLNPMQIELQVRVVTGAYRALIPTPSHVFRIAFRKYPVLTGDNFDTAAGEWSH